MADTGYDAMAARAQARLGTRICGRYKIEGVLGIGGMATVYSATDSGGRGRVALKVLHPEVSMNADARRRFLREGKASNAVRHPGAVSVIDDHTAEDGAAVIVMELLDGQAVDEMWMRGGERLPPRTVMAIARELCEVLGAAHRAGVIHRDIKPANIFITYDGELKVLDFGLARMRDARSSTATSVGSVFGTPAYMAPEQATGLASQVNGQTDLWAVGAMMFALLTGKAVHEGETAQHVVLLAATKPARSLRSVMPKADPRLVAVVDQALMFDKTERFLDAAEMKSAICDASLAMFGDATPSLLGLMDTQAQTLPAALRPKRTVVGAVTTEFAPPPKKKVPPSPARVAVIAGVAVMVVSLAAFALARRGEEPPPPRVADVPSARVVEAPPPPPATATHSADVPVVVSAETAAAAASEVPVSEALPTAGTRVSAPRPKPLPRATKPPDDIQRNRK
jgi:serine/threonine-protein kinase